MHKKNFPIFKRIINDKPLVYLDNAATTQKPQSVIDAINNYYSNTNANIHRAVHTLSEEATQAYENARIKVQQFINAASIQECIFTCGTTEAINLVANSFGAKFISKGDEVLISQLEHHSNIVPWQLLCERVGATLKFIPMNKTGDLILDNLDQLLTNKTKLVAISYISNAIGTIVPVKTIINAAHNKNIPVLIDAAQAMAHVKVDVQELDCDFLAFSGHKIYGPTGIGVLYAKQQYLEQMPPFNGGGEMIVKVSFSEATIYNDLPHKFEAGTPNIAGAIGLGAAIDYLNSLDFQAIHKQEQELLAYATQQLTNIPELMLYGNSNHKAGIITFNLGKIHPHDVGT
ncbi:MAG: cysteine desulfurase CsdA, partial [Legionellales bacterium]